MAGDWIEVEHATPDKPEVIQIADILGLDQDAVFGKLMRLWIWADMQSRDGNVRSVTRNFIDRHTRVTGFADAMKESGWLEENGHGLTFPNFDRHNGETAKKRALSRKRVAKFRAQNSNADVTQQALHKRNHRTEQNNSNTPLPPFSSFVKTWNATPGVRKAITENAKRIKTYNTRSKEKGWVELARKALEKFPLKCFATDPAGWQPDIDWFLRPGQVTSILEGKCDWAKSNGNASPFKDQQGEYPLL